MKDIKDQMRFLCKFIHILFEFHSLFTEIYAFIFKKKNNFSGLLTIFYYCYCLPVAYTFRCEGCQVAHVFLTNLDKILYLLLPYLISVYKTFLWFYSSFLIRLLPYLVCLLKLLFRPFKVQIAFDNVWTNL